MLIQPRLVVFTGDLSYNVRRNIVDLDALIPNISWLVLVHAPRRTFATLWASQRRNLRKHGWRWISYQVTELLARLRPHVNRLVSEGPGSEYTAQRLQTHKNVQIVRVTDLHDAACLARLRDFAPDLGLSLAAPILMPALFKLPRLGTLNLHKGKLPDFRGMPPAFWELWHDQTSVGCSVHWVEERLDAGAVLAESTVERAPFSTVRGLQLQLDESGSSLVCEVAKKVLAGPVNATRQVAGAGHTYRKPSLLQQSQLVARLNALAPRQASHSGLKNAAARLAFALHRALLWRFLKPRVTVLLYHRVCDDARDNLSTGVAQFERQMRLLSEQCEVVPIEQVLEMRTLRRSARPQVAVTFDDGYLDNYLNAVPALRRFSVPAAFFVSTGIVNTRNGFPHDKKRGNAAIEVLNWDHLRAMRDWGFTIGSHTVNHIDCVQEDEGQVRHELARSHADLTRELGPTPLIFAYPYGGEHQMNAQRLQCVKNEAYTGCLSAFGGSNIGSVNRWRVLRRGIHWEFSDAAFLYQCLGY